MPSLLAAGLLLAAAYLIGSIPIGYLIGRARGVDLFREGSGNIGATNVGRVLGRKAGGFVFALDFLKGVLPVASIEPLAKWIDPAVPHSLGLPSALPVGAAIATFLGHLFPIALGFRGGKGVATGAGAVAVLVPAPFLTALFAWALIVLVSRIVSLGSLVAVGVLVAVRLVATPNPFDRRDCAITTFCCLGTLLVVVKHRANLRRLLAGTESRIGDSSMRHTLIRVVHVLAVGFWFGGAGFFNLVAAPTIFRSFEEVVANAPSDRTANVPIVPADVKPEDRKETEKKLASALAGSAVGPIFPLYFAVQVVCAILAVATAWVWRRADGGRRVHVVRIWVTVVGLLTVLVGSALSNSVSQLRVLRFDPDPNVAKASDVSFVTLHLVSLGLSFVTVSLAGVALALAAKLPREECHSSDNKTG